METRSVILGAGGHALSIADAATLAGLNPVGCVAPRAAAATAAHLPWLGDESCLQQAELCDLPLINGLGSAGPVALRKQLYLRLRAAGRRFAGVIHPAAVVSTLGGTRGDALQLLATAVIGPGVHLGDNVLINTGAIVDHGCRVGSHCHVASGAVLCGDCVLGDDVHVGAGATVIQGIHVGYGAVIAAGAVVTRNVDPLTLVAGVPGREIRRIDEQRLA